MASKSKKIAAGSKRKRVKQETSKSEQERLLVKAEAKKWGKREAKTLKQKIKAQKKQAVQKAITIFRKSVSGHAVYKGREKDFKSFIKTPCTMKNIYIVAFMKCIKFFNRK